MHPLRPSPNRSRGWRRRVSKGNLREGSLCLYLPSRPVCLAIKSESTEVRSDPIFHRSGSCERASFSPNPLAPNQTVEPKYQVIQVLTTEGELLRGFRVREDDKELVLKDPAKGIETVLAKVDIEKSVPQATLMPDGLLGPLSEQDRADLVAFLADLGHSKKLQPAIMESVLMHAQPHDATTFAFTNQPLDPSSVPYHQAHVNRDRLYDFYAKQAIHFRDQKEPAKLLMQFPGLDGGKQGHWGNQNEDTWVNGDWNNTLLSSVQSGVFHTQTLNRLRAAYAFDWAIETNSLLASTQIPSRSMRCGKGDSSSSPRFVTGSCMG